MWGIMNIKVNPTNWNNYKKLETDYIPVYQFNSPGAYC